MSMDMSDLRKALDDVYEAVDVVHSAARGQDISQHDLGSKQEGVSNLINGLNQLKLQHGEIYAIGWKSTQSTRPK